MEKNDSAMESAKHPEWALTPGKVEKAVRRIVDVGKPRKIILFGSFVKGATTFNSDLDVLVITGDEISSPRKESVRIRRALRGISMPMDIIVVPETKWLQFRDCPGTIYQVVWRTGKVAYEA